MRPPIQLIAMDMDGTLLGGDHVTVPARNVSALRRAAQLGVKLAIASGRTWSLMEDAAEQLGGIDYAIVSNGAAIRAFPSGETLCRRAIPNAQAVALIRLLHRFDIPFEVYWDGQNYVRRADKERVHHSNPESYRAFFEARTIYPEDLIKALAGGEVEKFNLFFVPPAQRQEVERQARKTGQLEVANAFGENMELTAGGVSKGSALELLCRRLGLTPEEVMAFGDAGNDLEMLTMAKWSFAMENATAQAKAAARYQTCSHEQGGVGQAVEQYLLEQ